MSDTENRVGDVHSADPDLQVQVVTDPAPAAVEAQGDTVVTDPTSDEAVTLVDLPDITAATAGELRAKGYDVPDAVKDDEVPRVYSADRRVSADDPEAVVLVQLPTNPADDGLTPIERAMLDTGEDEEGETETKPKAKAKGKAKAKANESDGEPPASGTGSDTGDSEGSDEGSTSEGDATDGASDGDGSGEK